MSVDLSKQKSFSYFSVSIFVNFTKKLIKKLTKQDDQMKAKKFTNIAV